MVLAFLSYPVYPVVVRSLVQLMCIWQTINCRQNLIIQVSLPNILYLLRRTIINVKKMGTKWYQKSVGSGVGAVEVPRGILFHDYSYNDKGVCTRANCVIPTNQNHDNIQQDMAALVPLIANKSQKEIELTLEMLVRAYDPCISCSTHVTKIN